MSILIVCTANVCRSPTAEALWRASALRRGVTQAVSSAGLQARPGDLAHPVFIDLLAARQLDLRAHRARPFLRATATAHELILVMEPAHARHLQRQAPELAGRVQLLGRWTSGPIADPIGQPTVVFEQCLQVLERAVDSWLDKLSGRRSAPAPSGPRN